MNADDARYATAGDGETIALAPSTPAGPSGGEETIDTRSAPSARSSVAAIAPGPAETPTLAMTGEATLELATDGRATAPDDPGATQAFTHGGAATEETLARTEAGGPGRGGKEFHVPPNAGTDGSRFQIVRPHARGGLGEVFVALDAELSREVALKEIQEKHADDPVSRTRFVLEAEVTGGLEHPGIVPVYGLGQYRDGRPYYAMRFIRGESLKEAIDRFHIDSDRPDVDPGIRELALRGLLRRFVDVCHAMDYAHSRDVIHRDIKPANVMLGPYGETLVVDWGLAKALGRPVPEGDDAPKPLRPVSASGDGQTLYGSTIGTPHYMSPEQAEGDLDRMGPASDIYSLGATLYSLLTGTVPFQDRTIGALLAKVKRGEFPRPRAIKKSVPPALEAITLKAMSLRPEDRYQTARALADEIEHWMADEPIVAYREPWTARARRWARRHRTAVTTAASLLVTAVVGLTVATVLIDRERARTEAQRQLAQANFDLARDAVDSMLTELGAVDLVDIPQAEGVRREMLVKARDFYAAFLKQHGRDPGLRRAAGQAFGRAGDILEMLGNYDGAETSYRNGMTILEPLAVVGDDEARRNLARVQHGLGVLLKKSLRFREAEAALKGAVASWRGLAADDPDDGPDRKALTESVYQLGAVYARQEGRGPEAQKLYDEAIAARKRMVEDVRSHPDDRRMLARFLNNAGILTMKATPDEAAGSFREAAAIQSELIAKTPNVPSYRWEFARSRSNLGSIALGDPGGKSAEEYDAALALFKGLAEEYPAVPDYRFELAVVHGNRGLLRLNRGHDADAEADLVEAGRLLRKLAADYPGRPDFRMRLAEINRNLGILFQKTARLAPADESFRLALADHTVFAARHPDVPEYRAALGSTLDHYGRLLAADPAKAAEATKVLESAASEQRAALSGDGENRRYREFLQKSLRTLAQLRLKGRDYGPALEAIDEMGKALPADPKALCIAGRAAALVAAEAGDDPDLDDTQRAALRSRASTEAIGLLRESARRGFRGAAEFDHADYRALKDMAEFEAIRESVRAGAFAG